MATRQEVRDALASLPPDDGATVYDASSGTPVKVAHRDPLSGGGFKAVLLNADAMERPDGCLPSSIQP